VTLQATTTLINKLSSPAARLLIQNACPIALQVLTRSSPNEPLTDTDVAFIAESVRFLEGVCPHAEQPQLSLFFAMFLPLLMMQLRDPVPSTTSKDAKDTNAAAVHHLCLQTLNAIGPKYPEAFKTVIMAAPQLKQRLENAIRAGMGKAAAGQTSSATAVQTAKPKIELKMDFSAFK
jgi:HEAT repeat-containing protein 5